MVTYLFIILSLFLSGWSDSRAFIYAHEAYSNGKIVYGAIALSFLGFLGGAFFYLTALWFMRGVVTFPAIVEFLIWLAVAYVGILLTNREVLHWPLPDHAAIVLTLLCVTFLAYRHGE